MGHLFSVASFLALGHELSSTIKSPQLKWTRDCNDLTPLKITFAVALFQNLLRTALSLAGGNTVPENLLTDRTSVKERIQNQNDFKRSSHKTKSRKRSISYSRPLEGGKNTFQNSVTLLHLVSLKLLFHKYRQLKLEMFNTLG